MANEELWYPNSKHQKTNSKQIPMIKIQNSKRLSSTGVQAEFSLSQAKQFFRLQLCRWHHHQQT